jgi:MFS family permease
MAAAFNYYDRYLLAILIEPIKEDLGLSDTQIGLLSGFAFAVVYCSAAIPIARIADRGFRVRVLGAALGIWSVMTALTGFASNYAQLIAFRLGVAVGESGGLPSTHAIVVEYVPQSRRATALSIVAFVSAIGTSAAMIFGGLIADSYGWRGAFIIAGIPGLLLGLLIWLTIAEPRPASSQTGQDPLLVSPGLREALGTLWRRRSFVYFCVGTGFGMISVFAFQIWAPSFIMRKFNLSAGEVSMSYSIVFTVGNLAAALLGGILYDILFKRDVRWAFWLQAISFGASLPLGLAFLFAPSYTFLLLITPAVVLISSLYATPAYALVQGLSGPRLRATGAATFMLVANLVGFGLGPSIVGVLSDTLAPTFGSESLQYALAVVFVSGPVAAMIFVKAAGSVASDLDSADPGSVLVKCAIRPEQKLG